MLTDKEIEQAVTKAGGGWDGDHWKFEDADLHPFVRGLLAAEREQLCAAIKAADDKASEGDYMLDSDDCISVIRGLWCRSEEHDA